MDLKTTYLGLKLRTPLVPAASPLSEEIDGIKQMEDAGASAVVLYSLFEEQLRQDRAELDHHMEHGTESFAEAQVDADRRWAYYQYLAGRDSKSGNGGAPQAKPATTVDQQP